MFQLGQTVATAGISTACQDPVFANNVRNALAKYTKQDWGDLGLEDKQMNDEAVKNNNDRILAAYNVADSENNTKRVYIITEYDRSSTTILFADEY